MLSKEEKEGRTPNGGIRSEIYYRDDEGNSADKSVATRAEIIEFDDKGEVISRTHGMIGSQRRTSNES